MDYRTFVAWLVWAVDTDQLSFPVDRAWEKFSKTAGNIKRTYTDPDDPLLYCKNCVSQSIIDVATDYALWFAKSRIISTIISTLPEERDRQYGNLTNIILKVA